jgi:predicted unusual protein kinase regulating ubiquinone biosynthesis (AarF/ABC1/UbiB family)
MPPQLSQVLTSLRDDAHRMPLGQVAGILNNAWGHGWENNFARFSFTPMAAASIGQVHEALMQDGRRLAIKIQYPGIRQSIDSDIDNVASLLKLLHLMPQNLDFAPLLQEAKVQLHDEADYRKEALALKRCAKLLADDHRYQVPEVVDSLSTDEVLSMTYLDGRPIEILAELHANEKNRAASNLLELALREVFEWGLVQTDPNFSNYLYKPGIGKVQLLDFGATKAYTNRRRLALRGLLKACLEGHDQDIMIAASKVGYLVESDSADHRQLVVSLLRTVTEPVRKADTYAFGKSDIAERMKHILIEMRLKRRFGRIPPPEILFLHRKLGGLYLLLSRLNAEVPVKDIAISLIELQGPIRPVDT